MRLRTLPLLACAATAVTVAGVVPAVAAPTAPVTAAPAAIPDSSAVGTYYPDATKRILDTRTTGGRLGPGRSVTLTPSVTGVAHPSAVALNLTAVSPSSSGYLTAYPSGKALPRTSSINFGVGQTVANLVTVPVGSDGKIVIYNGFGSTDVVVDQLGAYAADNGPIATRGRGGGYLPADAQRLLDTRADGLGQVAAGSFASVAVTYEGSGGTISALAVNVTVTNPRTNGYLTAWDGATATPPRASTLNFSKGATVANAALVPVSPCTSQACGGDAAKISVYNGSGAGVDMVIDLVGFYGSASLTAPVRYQPLASPVRIVDSRSKLGLTTLGQGGAQSFITPASVAGDDTVGIDANVTAVKPTRPTYLTLWPRLANYPRPTVSTVNAGTGQVVSNHAIQEIGDAARVNVYNYAGNTDVVVDVSGTFENIATAGTAVTPAALTRVGPAARQQAVTR